MKTLALRLPCCAGAEEDQALADLGARVYQYVTRKIRGLIGEIQFAEVC